MSLRAISLGRWPGYWVTLLTIGAVLGGGALSGCSTAPPSRPDGLPIVPRYTNTIQLDWMLSGYNRAADHAGQGDKAADKAGALLEDACLGWERAIFDLESARRYPSIIRMSTEGANLMALLDSYPEIVRRHPRPAACEPPPPAAPAASAAPTEAASAANPDLAQAQAQAAATGSPASIAGDSPSLTAPRSPGGQVIAETAPAPTPATPVAAASAALTERQLLARLRNAVGIGFDPANRRADLGAVDMTVLNDLAQSEVAPIRLRARYHLLGQCILATELADASWRGPGASAEGTLSVCAGRAPRESLHAAQKRLSRAMLQAFRGRWVEPFGDFVVGLASMAARDNPSLDGQRISR